MVKHFNDVTLRELNSEWRIYQPGAFQKVNIVQMMGMLYVPGCFLLQHFGRSSVVLNKLELGVVGLPYQTIENLSSNDLSRCVSIQLKGSCCTMKSLLGQETLQN